MKSKPRKDAIVEEMRAAGDRIARSGNYDINKFAEHFIRLQRHHPERLVNFESSEKRALALGQERGKRKTSAEAETQRQSNENKVKGNSPPVPKQKASA